MIETQRLILRQWQTEDLEQFAKMNADPQVMRYFPTIKTFDESLEEYARIKEHFERHNYGFWAVSERNKDDFIGFIGLRYIDFPANFTPTVEIGWRLKQEFWGRGYATEGAVASLKYGFEQLNLPEIVSFTSALNHKSQAVMQRIGLHHEPENDFNHPKLPETHPLRKHVLYRIRREEWKKFNGIKC